MSAQAFSYHEVLPENSKETYSSHENVDFNLTFEGRAINLGSIRIEGELEVKDGGLFLNNAANTDKFIYLNEAVGAHACFESVQTTIAGQVIEIAQDYPRWVNMATRATSEQGSFGNNSDQTCELKASYYQHLNQLIQGQDVGNQPTVPVRLNPDFSIKPLIALNTSARSMPYGKSGPIRLSLNLARVNGVFWGQDVTSGVTYSVRDLRVTFSSIPEEDSDAKTPITLRTRISMKQSIQSTLANVSLRVPGICTGVSCSFLPQSYENAAFTDSLQLTTVPLLNSVQFAFNDITSSLVTYKLKTDNIVIDNFLKSMFDTGLNTLQPSDWANQEGYGVGVSFDGSVDLRNQKFAVQLNSAISSNNPHVIYLYFHSFLNL